MACCISSRRRYGENAGRGDEHCADVPPRVHIRYRDELHFEFWDTPIYEDADFDFCSANEQEEETYFWLWMEPQRAKREKNINVDINVDITAELLNSRTVRNLRACDKLFAQANSLASSAVGPDCGALQDLGGLLEKREIEAADAKSLRKLAQEWTCGESSFMVISDPEKGNDMNKNLTEDKENIDVTTGLVEPKETRVGLTQQIRGGTHTSDVSISEGTREKLCRLVEVVVVRVRKEGETLVEVKRSNDGETIVGKARLPGTKRRHNEDVLDTARRCLHHRLPTMEYTFRLLHVAEEEENSVNFPGVKTLYRKHFIEAVIDTSAPVRKTAFVRWNSNGTREKLTRWEWWTEEKCLEHDIFPHKSYYVEGRRSFVSSENSSNLGSKDTLHWDRATLVHMLREEKIEVEKFGKNVAKNMDSFVGELKRKECHFLSEEEKKSFGLLHHEEIMRSVTLLVFRILDAKKRILLLRFDKLKDGRYRMVNCLPTARKVESEDAWALAARFIEEELGLSTKEVYIRIDNEEKFEIRYSVSYPNVLTLYRKLFVDCVMKESCSIDAKRRLKM